MREPVIPDGIALETRTLDIGSGTTLRYYTSGSGPAVLMIQGVGVTGTGWKPQVDALCSRFRVITFDNRGIGASTAGPDRLTVDAMMSDALAIMGAEGIERFHVVGHSMGGLIAQQLALAAGQRVLSLALLCTFADGKDGSRMSPGMIVTGLRLRIGTRRMRRNAMLDLIMPAQYLDTTDRIRLAAELQELFGRDLADQPPIIMRQLRAMSGCSTRTRLTELPRVPTLVMSGAHDRIARPALGRSLAEGIAGARYVEFAEAGHALPIQCAAAVNALLHEHLAEAEARRRRSGGPGISQEVMR